MSEEIRRIKLVKSTNINEAESDLARDRRAADGKSDKEHSADLVAQRLSNMGRQADLLQSLIHELKSMSDLTPDATLRDTGTVRGTEAIKEAELAETSARLRVKEETIEARELALKELEAASKARIEEVEKLLEERKAGLDRRESELGRLAARVRGVVNRLNQADSESQNTAERLEGELTELRQRLKAKDERLAAKELQLEKLEAELKELEVRLQTAESNSQSLEAQLKEKDTLIHAASVKEAEVGKLIARLSSECERLSSELAHKSGSGGRAEKKENSAANDGPIWKKMLGRSQEQ